MKNYVLKDNVYIDSDNSETLDYSNENEKENYILDVINGAVDLSVGSEELVALIKDWPSLFHLHPKRVNLLRPLEASLKERSILEIGSGYGAITRYLGELGSTVTAFDTNFRMAQGTAARCRDLSNVKVICDDFREFPLSEQFDVVLLIGALGDSNLYLGGDDPAGAMLDKIKEHLRPGGIVIIGIENKLGLKYWAGAPEDRTGQAYLGIENRYTSSSAVTFGKKELIELLGRKGFPENTFLYPFPDYKLPESVVTSKGMRTEEFSVPMLLLEGFEYIQSEYYSNHFSTSLAAAELDRNGLLVEFSNSFLAVASPLPIRDIIAPDLLAVRYNSQRKKEYQKVSSFRETEGRIIVERKRLYTHVPIPEQPVKNDLTHEPYFKGRLLLFDAIKIVSRKQWMLDSLVEWAGVYFQILKDRSVEADGQFLLDGKYLDLTPFNIILGEQNEFRIFDQEWIYPGSLPLGYVFFRGINYSLGAISFFNIPSEETPLDILKLTIAVFKRFLPLSDKKLDSYRELEIKNISGIGVTDYTPFLGAPLKIRKEPMMERQIIRMEQTEVTLKTTIEQLNSQLAHVNHDNFLKEAELEAVHHMAVRQPPSFPEIVRITEEMTRLGNLIESVQIRKSSPIGKSEQVLETDPMILNRQITDLQNSLLWYKRTYEDRSFLGVIRQKIALKFAK